MLMPFDTLLPYIVRDENAQYYECGFSCDNAIVLHIQDQCFFITDSRYTLEAKQNVYKHVEVLESSDLLDTLATLLATQRVKKLTFNPNELSVGFYQTLLSHTQRHKCELLAAPNFHQKLRIIKSDSQIALIQKSQKLNKQAFKEFARFVRKAIQKGKILSERDLHFYATMFLSHKGVYDLSFNPIVGLNATGAKPHALPSEKNLCKNNDLLLFDAGIKYQRYCSDRTRTANVCADMIFGKSQKFASKKQQKIYDIVLKAQERAISKARSGMRGYEIDALARDVIESSGYGKYFVHSTGHGVGLDIHELPHISAKSEEIIQDGMVFSIEPGIYLGDEFGVRIEDLVVMKNGRAEVL